MSGVDDLTADEARTPGLRACRAHRPWSTVLLSTYVAATVVTSTGCVLVLGLLAAGSRSQGARMWDGLGEDLALMSARFTAAACAASPAFMVLTHKGRRRADSGNPNLLRATSCVGIGLGLLVTMQTGADLLARSGVFQPVLLAALTMAPWWTLANVRVLRAAGGLRAPRRMPSPG